jgi:hypothetical protein
MMVQAARQPYLVKLALLAALLGATLAVPGCHDCEFKQVEATLEWRIPETDEKGLVVGSVSTGNVSDYEAIQGAVLDPANATGQLVGMMDAPREGRMRLATFALPFPLVLGDVIVGRGPGGGGWGFFPSKTFESGMRVVFEPAPVTAPPTAPSMQRMEVIALAPLRLLLSWIDQSSSGTTSVTGTMRLSRTVTHGVCE